MHRKVEEAVKAVASQIKRKPANDVPDVQVRMGVVQGFPTGTTASVIVGAATTPVTYRWLYNASFTTGDTVVVIRFGNDGFILGKLA